MGMFDRVIVEYPLPDVGAVSVKEWQTKDFDYPYLNNYRIGADGRLYSEQIHYEDQSDKSAPKGSLLAFMGCMTPVHEAWVDMNYSGTLNFYGDAHTGELCRISLQPETFLQDLAHPQESEWFDYTATFECGSVTAIEREIAE